MSSGMKFSHKPDNRLGIKYLSQPLQFKHEPIIPKQTHFTATVQYILNLCHFCFFTVSLVTEISSIISHCINTITHTSNKHVTLQFQVSTMHYDS
jgi:hypothetical protein